MKSETLNTLLGGHFVCPYAFPDAYADLCEPGAAERVNQWLSSLDRRLARLGDDGAFYVAPLRIQSNEQIAKVKADLAQFRATYGLVTEMLNLVRLAKEGFRCVPGEFVQLSDVVTTVNGDSTLVARLREMRIPGGSSNMSNHELLKKLLERLRSEGYLVLANPKNEAYQVTGRIDHLHEIYRFLVENVTEMADAVIDDTEDPQEGAESAQPDLIRNALSGDDKGVA